MVRGHQDRPRPGHTGPRPGAARLRGLTEARRSLVLTAAHQARPLRVPMGRHRVAQRYGALCPELATSCRLGLLPPERLKVRGSAVIICP